MRLLKSLALVATLLCGVPLVSPARAMVSATSALSGPFTPNSSTKDFPFTFAAASASEVRVFQRNGSTDTNMTGYTVTLSTSGGTVHFASAPATGSGSIYIQSNPSFQQTIDLQNQGPFLPSVINQGYDRAAIRDIYLNAQLGATVRAPVGDTLSILPNAAARANGILGFDGSGNVISYPAASFVGAQGPTGPQGPSGPGTGDMLRANNLSDLTNKPTALSNLGGAPLASPALTGTPTAPTASNGTSTTQLATTAFVAAYDTSLSAAGSSNATDQIPCVQTSVVKTCTPVQIVAAGSAGLSSTGPTISPAAFSAVADGTQISGAVTISSGSAALTVAGASFASGDVGKAISVAGIGASGAPLTTTISARTDATHITLGATASTSRSGVTETIFYGTDNHTALTNWLGACATYKATCYLSGGAYAMTGTLSVVSGVKIAGSGVGQSTLYFLSAGVDAIAVNTAAAVDISGFMLAGQSGILTGVSGSPISLTAPSTTLTGNVSITSGAAALTLTGASFSSADIGKSIVVPGAGAGGAPLETTIVAVTDATHATMGANAGTTLSASSKTVNYGFINYGSMIHELSISGGNVGVNVLNGEFLQISNVNINNVQVGLTLADANSPYAGDFVVTNVNIGCSFASPSSTFTAINITSGGNLAVSNSLLHFCQYALVVNPNIAFLQLGDIYMANTSMEQNVTACVSLQATTPKNVNSVNFVGGDCAGGTPSGIWIGNSDTDPILDVSISGMNIDPNSTGGATYGVLVHGAAQGVTIVGNSFANGGGASSTGIGTVTGAKGVAGVNSFRGLATNVNNGASGTFTVGTF